MIQDHVIDSFIRANKKPQPPLETVVSDATRQSLEPQLIKKVNNRALAYSHKYRGQWFKPEYNLGEIQRAQDTESYLFRAIQKKVNRIVIAGFSFTGANSETVKYIKRRFNEMSWATQKPFGELVEHIYQDLFRYSNCMIAKVRNEEKSMGNVRKNLNGNDIDPVAGYFILPFETLSFKTKRNGEIIKVLEELKSGEKVEYLARDIIHFYTNKKPGFTIGTPEMFPALDDIALLRRIEENVEDLIETNLFPVYHYQVGTVDMPERIGPDGVKETDVVRKKIEYMPAGGVYVSDFRHSISAIGSEGRALRIDAYLTHFKNRMLSAIGSNALDMGEGDTANRSTAGTLAKSTLLDIEAMTLIVKRFIDFFMIGELMLEGGYDPFDDEQKVEIRFGIIDKEERRADENQQIQLWTNNLRTLDEVREALGFKPWEEEQFERTHFRLYGEPADLLRGAAPGSAASEALGTHPNSSITPKAVKAEQKNAETLAKKSAVQGRPATKSASKNTSANKARPANQYGSRSSAKTTRDIALGDGERALLVTCDQEVDSGKVNQWFDYVNKTYDLLGDKSISFETFASTLLWRL